jgi:signal peptidase I
MAANDGLKLPGPAFPSATTAPPVMLPHPVARPHPKTEEGPVVKDVFREIVETVVFVIVLVFLLKIFVAEAFVIPTGSMAETLLGYQRFVECPQCHIEFPVNCSQEVDPQDRPRMEVDACTCPNCRYRIVWREPVGAIGPQKRTIHEPPSWGSGDRVLVSKFPYDKNHLERLGRPDRFNVVVFKFPKEPQKGFVPMNYIKRLIGLPGETIAIYNGDLYVFDEERFPGELTYPPTTHPLPDRPEDLWQLEDTYPNDSAAEAAFRNGKFRILRKTPEIMLAMRRLVYDNDHQADNLIGVAPPRWQMAANSHWSADNDQSPKVFSTDGSGPNVEWLRYQHLIVKHGTNEPPSLPGKVEPIMNFMGYNAGEPSNGRIETNWVGDLMLECTAKVENNQGELILELAEGSERFQAQFDLASGDCSLVRLGGREPQVLAKQEKVLTKLGTYALRFANFDDRLTVWVDGTLPFGEGIPYVPATPDPDHENNKQPANIGVRGGAKLSVSKVQLWRDTFYTVYPDAPSQLAVKTMHVQPGHYLCLGDNSTESADSRSWGLVPERLMLGRALLVYWPVTRAGVIR